MLPEYNCIIWFLFRMDQEYHDNNFNNEQLRNDICSQISKDENKDLHHVLYFGTELVSPEDWKELMTLTDNESLYCDLPFIQLASNYLKRQFVLIEIDQPENSSEKCDDMHHKTQKIFEVTPNEITDTNPFFLIYFPKGKFGPHAYFQSVFKKDKANQGEYRGWASCDITKLNDTIQKSKKVSSENIADSDDDDEESEEEENISISKATNKSKNIKKTKKSAGTSNNNAYNAVTMLTPLDPAAKVVVNNTGKTIRKKVNRKDPTYEIAPGEGKVSLHYILQILILYYKSSLNSVN